MKWKKKKERRILEIWRMTMNRTQTRQVQVKNLEIGHNNHVIIQSMCNIETKKADEVEDGVSVPRPPTPHHY